MDGWLLQDAKARFSELVNECRECGPQLVTRHGVPAVVVVAAEEYQRLTARRESLRDFFGAAPRVVLDCSRSTDLPRDVQL